MKQENSRTVFIMGSLHSDKITIITDDSLQEKV